MAEPKTPKKRRRASKYTDDEIRAGLSFLAKHGGHFGRAATEAGVTIHFPSCLTASTAPERAQEASVEVATPNW